MSVLQKYGLSALSNKVLAGFLLIAAPAQADVHLLALGDSLTQGYGLIEQDGFVPQLRRWLAGRGHTVRVVNGGVSGDTTAGGLARVEWTLTPEINGMIVALGGNDLLRGIDPATVQTNLDGILAVARAHDIEVLLVGMIAPGNYGPDYKSRFDAIYPSLAEHYGTEYLDTFFAGLTPFGDTPADLVEYMQPDGIHPNTIGVEKIVEAIGPKVEDLIERIDD
jgi:acyl-CoA thioesterase-1